MDDHERTRPPLTAGEVDTLLGFLEHFRDTLRWKTEGLDSAQLTRRLGPSTMTLRGLTLVEDWDWHSASDDTPDELRALFDRLVAQSGANVQGVLDHGGLDGPSVRTDTRKGHVSVRWILVHLIEEYARHDGHADLVRESVDGQVGD